METIKPQMQVITFTAHLKLLLFLAASGKTNSKKCTELGENKLLVPNTDYFNKLINQYQESIV